MVSYLQGIHLRHSDVQDDSVPFLYHLLEAAEAHAGTLQRWSLCTEVGGGCEQACIYFSVYTAHEEYESQSGKHRSKNEA